MAVPREAVLLLLLLIFHSLDGIGAGSADTNGASVICNAEKFDPDNDPFFYSRQLVLGRIIAYTCSYEYSYYIWTPDNATDFHFAKPCAGFGACNGEISCEECRDCLRAAKDVMQDVCQWSVGAQAEVKDCRLRYDDLRFDH